MYIVTRKQLREAAFKFKDAAIELGIWTTIAEGARWHTFEEVRRFFPDVDKVSGYVVFNIRHNRYRLITVIHYAKGKPKSTDGHIYVRSVLTHKEYDNRHKWDPYAQ